MPPVASPTAAPKADPGQRDSRDSDGLRYSVAFHNGLSGSEGKPRQPGALADMYRSHNKVERRKVTTIAYGISGKPKLLSYDLKHLVRYGGIITAFTRGTILRVDDGMLKFMLTLMLLFVCVAGVMWAAVPDLKAVDTTSLQDLADYMNGFVPFVLGLYVSLAIGRWWALRVQALGAVFDSVANVTMIISCVLSGPQHAAVRDLVVKWGMASIFLLVKAARDIEEMDDLFKKGVLSESEVDALKNVSPYGRAMIMWAWIMRLAQETFDDAAGPGPHAPKLVAVFQHCILARNGVQTIHTYLQTQLPFAYVHLITLLVNINNFIVAFKCGVVFVVANAKGDRQEMMYQVLMFMLVPILYHGLLSISYVIHDPFGEDMLDFPIAAFAEYVAECCDAALVAQQLYPGTPKPLAEPGAAAAAAAAAGPQQRQFSSHEGIEVDPMTVATPLAEAMREATSVIFAELKSIGSQIKRLQDSIGASETRRGRDAEKLAGVILKQAQIRATGSTGPNGGPAQGQVQDSVRKPGAGPPQWCPAPESLPPAR
eukprot:gnl/TRDRNA2_/TRDRNA2_193977_c0_seq1.p1 gnl/TRDRNA2_/TRDRNA2_193977_c0~~gnl/TRDRNA2_/TRDRNA2_193977_c0_seq1.p1  ORF type:complete len:541 (+),score=94.54 gnl/TRDRNA2_/TRDRNA2_193977_c0_seq1:95-1717(+)